MKPEISKDGKAVLWILGGIAFVCVLLVWMAVHESSRARKRRENHPPPIYREELEDSGPELEPLPVFRMPEEEQSDGQDMPQKII